MNEIKLIALYYYICECYNTELCWHCQRFSNNSQPDFTDEELLSAVSKMLEKLANRRAVEAKPLLSSHNIIGNSPGMQHVYRLIEKAAAASVNVLISGESGTGKELVARAIHYSSKIGSGPFVTVNCTAIPDSLLQLHPDDSGQNKDCQVLYRCHPGRD